jgi:thioredoxin reductase/Pyruvate/2-oxoacid:ferredoxin oxidoreductase delta subunit
MLVNVGFGALLLIALWAHVRRFRRRETAGRDAAARTRASGARPQAQHPRIDVQHCIGCGACADACPEGAVLAVVAGTAALVQPERCIGHGLCAEACPVGAIEIVTAPPGLQADTPYLSRDLETNVPGVFVAGELGGLALIKNAIRQGRECVDTVARRKAARPTPRSPGVLDVCIAGAGPAGLSAALRAQEIGLTYVLLEQASLGGSVAKYPRQKLVLTSPFELPLYGKFNKLKIRKEELLALWTRVVRETRLAVRTGERVEHVQRDPDGALTVTTTRGQHRARAVILAIGRRGTPRTLGIAGEELPKVMYDLLDAAAYRDRKILVVGGGDSAVEAALGLAHQRGNRVTLSYRRGAFTRLKARNEERIADAVRRHRVTVLFNSAPLEVRPASVVLDVRGERRELPNEFVWIFAGGTPPTAFLERIGVTAGMHGLSAA